MTTLIPYPTIGGVTAYDARPLGVACDLDLAGSASPGADRALFARALATASARAARYPDTRPLAERIATRFAISAENVLVTAGADEALDRACRAMLGSGRSAIVTDPTFEMLPRYVALTGGALKRVPWSRGAFPVDAALALADGDTALVGIVTPNNPTGEVVSVADIRCIHDALYSALVLVDLAYVEFADADPTRDLLALPRVVVTRTLSKAWSLPGIRVGYAIGAPSVIGWMRRAGGPYSVSSLSLAVAEWAFDAGDAKRDASVAKVKANRAKAQRLLRKLGRSTTQSQGNFVCIDDDSARDIRDALAELGIATRLLSGTDRERLRITIPADDASFARLERSLQSAIGEVSSCPR